jgi:hypothetical protein
MCILCAKKIFFSAGVKKQQEKLKLLEKQVLLIKGAVSSYSPAARMLPSAYIGHTKSKKTS